MNELLRLKRSLETLIETRTIKLATGNVSDFTVYKQIVGELRGISLALGEIDDIMKQSQEDEDI